MTGYEGLRVLRGPDWEGGDSDGGEGYLGTLVQLADDHKVRVLWDMGQETTCNAGHDGKFELRVFDTAQAGVRHPTTCCAVCGETNIFGMLWRCQDCAGCDLCTRCYSDDKHDLRHRFLRIDTPGCKGQPCSKRKTSVKVRAIGIFPGAKVVRGKDWQWGDQDGGQGSEGEVRGYRNVISRDSARNRVLVEWPSGVTHSYRLGDHGNVDVTCVEEEVGPFYYRNHLPLLDITEASTLVIRKTFDSTAADNIAKILDQSSIGEKNLSESATTEVASAVGVTEVASASGAYVTSVNKEETAATEVKETGDLRLAEGDRVAIKVGDEKLKELQQHFGGCTARMIRCIGRTGEVTGISSKGAVSVKFGKASKVSYRFNQLALIKVAGEFSVQETVRVRSDGDLLKLLNTRLGWPPQMDRTLNKVGRVVKVDEDGDLRVEFNGCAHLYAPACCLPAPGCDVDDIDGDTPSGSDESVISNPADQSDKTKHNLKLFRTVRDMLSKDDVTARSSEGHRESTRSLFAAITHGHHQRVRDMCQRDPSKLESECEETTPLIYATLKGQRQCVLTLLELGADVSRHVKSDVRKTPISAAIEGKDPSLIEVLLEHGADTTHLYDHGLTAAHMAVVKNQPVIIKALARHGADMNAKNEFGDTPLHMAIERQTDVVMETLVQLPEVDISVENKQHFNMIHLACLMDNSRALACLLDRDRSGVDTLRKGHSTALHIAATNDYVECVRLLVINGGANINRRERSRAGLTALHIVCHSAKLQTVEALLELDADVNVHDADGDTPLHLAIGGRIEGYGKSEEAEVEVACRVQISNMLISKGALVDARNHEGRHPFMCGHSRVRSGVRTFMTSHPDVVHWQNPSLGKTALRVESMAAASKDGEGQGRLKEALRGVGLPCGVCGAPKSDVTLQPCQHKCVCSACSGEVGKCPLCDEEVTDKVHTGADDQTVDPEACKQM